MIYKVMVSRFYVVDAEANSLEEALDLVLDQPDDYIESRPEENTEYEPEDRVDLFVEWEQSRIAQ